jgi:hypothetical protein
MLIRCLAAAATIALAACAPQPAATPGGSLIGVSKARFLQCSGPPQLSMAQGSQERITFLANRAQGTGLVGPAAQPLASCSGNATFQNDRLTNVSFGGDQTVCMELFAPCAAGKGQ